MGTVYLARDLRNGSDVAVKVLESGGVETLRRIKTEFRVASTLSHPNLVVLHELDTTTTTPFLTMEYIPGLPFLQAATGRPRATVASWLPPLAEALEALHREGILHLDLKPANILVTEEDRPVIVDFGLARSIRIPSTRDQELAGTPAFMAPELLYGAQADSSSDIYALGLLFYEALTGVTAGGAGGAAQILDRRARRSFPRPQELAPDLPAQVSDLIWRMLDPTPRCRPSAAQVVAALQGGNNLERSPLFGRTREQEELWALCDAHTPFIVVHGPAGIGKSRLLWALHDEAATRGVHVLASRCDPNERVTFPAINGLIDALVDRLDMLGGPRPRHDLAAERLFPVLSALRAGEPTGREGNVRSACVRYLRALLHHIGPTLITLDDAHQADEDSLRLLHDIFASPGRPPATCVFATRHEESEQRLWASIPWSPPPRKLALGGLSPEASLDLVRSIRPDLQENTAKELATHGRGDPQLLIEMALAAHEQEARSYEAIVADKVSRLDAEQRSLLRQVAVADRPLDWREAGHGLALLDPRTVVQRLIGLRLLRRVSARRVQLHHPHLAPVLLAGATSDELATLHGHLADALLQLDDLPISPLVLHLTAAHRPHELLDVARRAAEEAAGRAAYARAAELRGLIAEHAPPLERDAALLTYASALAEAGRGEEAGAAFEALSRRLADPALALQAMEAYVYSGHHEHGERLSVDVLRNSGDRQPSNELFAFFEAFRGEQCLRWRGLALRGDRSVPLLARIDALHATSLGLSMSRSMTSGALGYRHLHASLNSGDPARAARALAMHAAQHAFYAWDPSYTARMLGAARDLMPRVDDPEVRAIVQLTEAACDWAEHRLRPAADRTRLLPPELLRDRPGLRWHRATWHLVNLSCRVDLGDFEGLSAELPMLLADARSRADLHMAVNLRLRVAHHVWLALDAPDEAQRELEEGRAAWPIRNFDMMSLFRLCGMFDVALYQQDAHLAETLARAWSLLEKSMLLMVDYAGGVAWPRLARAALLAGRRGLQPLPDIQRILHRAQRALRGPMGDAESLALRGEWAALQNDTRAATSLLLEAAGAFDLLAMAPRAWACATAASRLTPTSHGHSPPRVDAPGRWGAMWHPVTLHGA